MKRPCARAGCPNFVQCGYCPAHASLSSRARAEQNRPSAAKRGYGRSWQKSSKAYLREHPLCVGYPHGYHGERPVLAECVDHIEPHKGDMRLFWNPENWQALCIPCNSRKAVVEEGAVAPHGGN